MRLHETEILLHSKIYSHQTEEAGHRMGENASYTFDKALITIIYRELKN
jgi:hypothetical protein